MVGDQFASGVFEGAKIMVVRADQYVELLFVAARVVMSVPMLKMYQSCFACRRHWSGSTVHAQCWRLWW